MVVHRRAGEDSPADRLGVGIGTGSGEDMGKYCGCQGSRAVAGRRRRVVEEADNLGVHAVDTKVAGDNHSYAAAVVVGRCGIAAEEDTLGLAGCSLGAAVGRSRRLRRCSNRSQTCC